MEGKGGEEYSAHGRVTLNMICKMMMGPGMVFLASFNNYYITVLSYLALPRHILKKVHQNYE